MYYEECNDSCYILDDTFPQQAQLPNSDENRRITEIVDQDLLEAVSILDDEDYLRDVEEMDDDDRTLTLENQENLWQEEPPENVRPLNETRSQRVALTDISNIPSTTTNQKEKLKFPSTLYLILEALDILNNKTGSTYVDIKQCIAENYPTLNPSRFGTLFRNAVEAGIKADVLTRVGFKLKLNRRLVSISSSGKPLVRKRRKSVFDEPIKQRRKSMEHSLEKPLASSSPLHNCTRRHSETYFERLARSRSRKCDCESGKTMKERMHEWFAEMGI